jgi:hypothetical protein
MSESLEFIPQDAVLVGQGNAHRLELVFVDLLSEPAAMSPRLAAITLASTYASMAFTLLKIFVSPYALRLNRFTLRLVVGAHVLSGPPVVPAASWRASLHLRGKAAAPGCSTELVGPSAFLRISLLKSSGP